MHFHRDVQSVFIMGIHFPLPGRKMLSEFLDRVSGIANSTAAFDLVRKLVYPAVFRVPEENSAAGLVAHST